MEREERGRRARTEEGDRRSFGVQVTARDKMTRKVRVDSGQVPGKKEVPAYYERKY